LKVREGESLAGPPLEDWEASIWPRMVESLFIHKNIDQQDLGLLEVRAA
jgi:hypothetical protein